MIHKRSRAEFEADLQAQQSPYVTYGTPLPPLDPNVRDDGSYVPVWKQEVTDDQGRKRLHGAFTGGFSAGYFNTVGSKEGWAPSAFVSSRSNRQKDMGPLQQKPEDFMDDEDIADAEEARKLQTTDVFSGLGSASETRNQTDAITDVLRTTGETMGVKLLKKMGWREGQGVGPKIRRAANVDENLDREKESTNQTFLFAPVNAEMIKFAKKNDRKGLGFEGDQMLRATSGGGSNSGSAALPICGDDGRSEDGSILQAKKSQVRLPRSKGGFGMGILNDNGSDDEDPYHMGPQISYNRITTSLKKEKKKKMEKVETAKSTSNPLLRSKPVFISKKTQLSKNGHRLQRCHDGRLPLDGFVVASDNSITSENHPREAKYPLPEIPNGWKSSKSPSGPIDSSKSTDRSVPITAAALKLSPRSRAALLGETQLPGKSVFDYLTPNARTRIASVTNNPNLPPALSEADTHSFSSVPRSLQSLVPPLAQQTALSALGRGTAGWMPYTEDPAKRARYRSFLEVHAGLRSPGTLPARASGASNEEWSKEMQEFAHAAQIFRPMTGMMATRFTSSSSATPAALDNPETEGSNGNTGDPKLLTQTIGKGKSPAEEAAAVGMYGPLTRSIEKFYPTRLLCKRFNIEPPTQTHWDPGESSEEKNVGAGQRSTEHNPALAISSALPGKKLELIGKHDMDNLRTSGYSSGNTVIPDGDAVSSDNDKGRKECPRKEAINPEQNEAIEKARPEEAVFRAIFGSDSEDE